MGLNVLDASVSIALVDDTDALYETAARSVETDPSDLVLPASGYAETMVRAHRAGSSGPVRAKLDGLGIAISPLSEAMADEAARLRARHPSLRLGDALVIATARILDADRVLTGDRRWAGVWDRIEVLEPDP
jgi:PIN domain nuclease of toxin-antitoxin system